MGRIERRATAAIPGERGSLRNLGVIDANPGLNSVIAWSPSIVGIELAWCALSLPHASALGWEVAACVVALVGIVLVTLDLVCLLASIAGITGHASLHIARAFDRTLRKVIDTSVQALQDPSGRQSQEDRITSICRQARDDFANRPVVPRLCFRILVRVWRDYFITTVNLSVISLIAHRFAWYGDPKSMVAMALGSVDPIAAIQTLVSVVYLSFILTAASSVASFIAPEFEPGALSDALRRRLEERAGGSVLRRRARDDRPKCR